MLFDSFFQAGNIITLAIVLIILAVYRQMDKDNRSLEKVKKFADRMKDEIGAFVDSRSRDMQNLSIELDVHQKTAKEILARLSRAEEAINERSEALEAVQSRIDGYDTTLRELGEMTAKVEENLKRIASESEFVDTVAKRVKAVSGQLDGVEKSIPQIEAQLRKESAKALEELKQDILKGVYDEVGRLKREGREIGEKVDQFSGFMDEILGKQSDTEREAIETLRGALNESLNELDRSKISLQDEFGEELRKRLDAALEEGRTVESAALNTLKAYIDRETDQVKSGFEESLTQVQEDLGGSLGEVQTELGGTLNQMRSEFSTTQNELERLFEALKSSSEDWRADAESSLEGHRLGIQKKISDLEARLLEYEEDTGYRFSRIEEITRDMDQLEETLRASMDRVSAKIRKEFADFAAVLAAERAEEREKASGELTAIHASMGELEEELNQLKTTAYDSVSEKLKLFEDDFFSDLRERNAAMQDQFQEWKERVRSSLEELAADSEQQRGAVENRYSEELAQRLDQVQHELDRRLGEYESEVNGFFARMNEKIGTTEADMKALEEGIRQDVEDARRQSRASFETVFTEHDTSIKDQLKKSEREYSGELKRLGDELSDGRKELSSILESAKSDVTVWQAQVLQQLKEAESKIGEDIAGFKLATKENTSALIQAYTEEQEELVQNSQEERSRIRGEIKNLNDAVLELQAELRKRSEEALDRQRRESEQAHAELQKRARDLLAESDERLKEFRTSAADLKEKVEGAQKRLFGKIEDQYKIQSVKLQEIDKRQKNFVAQTKIFDRADSLKLALEENLEDLKSEIARVDAMSKEIKESERKFVKVQKLGEEVSAKFTRFLNERNRIEEMEGDFKKLINLSQAIGTKLTDVTDSHDALTAVQAELRRLEELEKEVAVKYERLESKSNILEVTASGVDKNFQSLQQLEGRTKELGSRLQSLPKEIERLQNGIRDLSQNKERADEAVEKLSSLDATLSEIEERSDKLQQAREWLARTETRLQEVGKQAQEQVKLLGSIMKEESRRSGKEKGAPNLGAREVVTKLAHQGWSVEEIARATKLSRGEVELILELLPKKG